MKNWFICLVILITGLLCVPFMAIAQEASQSIPTDQFLMSLFASLGGLKGASALAIVGIVIQIIIKFLNSDLCKQVFKNFTGIGKLILISAMTLIGGVITLMITEKMSFGSALIHSTTLNAFMVMLNQYWQQYKKV